MKIYFFVFLFLPVLVFGQNKTIDSLEKVIATTKVDTIKGRSLCRLCKEYMGLSKYEFALKKGAEGLKISEQLNDLRGMATCMNVLGTIYHYSQGNYPKALEYLQKSLKINEKMGDKKGMTANLNNIGGIYNSQANFPKALEYYQLSLKIKEEIGDQFGIANTLNNIGEIFQTQCNYPTALEYFQKSLKISQSFTLKKGISANSFNFIGEVYRAQGNYPKALEYHQKSLMINQKIGNTAKISLLYCNIAEDYRKLNQQPTAKEYARKGLQLARQINHLKCLKIGVAVSFQVDSALGDWKSAFEHHKLFKQYSDSLNNEDKAKEFGKIESKYEFEKQAEAEKRAEQEKAKIEAEAKERRDNLQYLTIFAGIIGLFTGLLFIGKFKIPTKITEVLIFAGLLITFEFLLIFFDPYFEKYSGGIPFYKLGFNTLIAFGFAPLHSFLESQLKRRLVKGENA